jgi:hypothetical protein
MEVEAEKLRIESDPKIQATKLASTMAMLGDSAASERLMAFAQGKSTPIVPQPVQAPDSIIPDYIGTRGRINSSNIRPGIIPPSMGSGIGLGVNYGGFGPKSMKIGNVTLGQQSQSLDPISAANLDIQKGLVAKGLESEQTTSQGAEKTLMGLDDYLKQYGRSWNEMTSKNPDIGAEGLYGKLDRLKGEFDVWSDNAPETKVLRDQAEPFAQQIATDLEGRATDQDRIVQKNLFADVLKGPTTSNVRKASNHLIGLQKKGADATKVMDKLFNSGVPPLVKIAEEFYKEFPKTKMSVSLDKNLMSAIDKELAKRNA